MLDQARRPRARPAMFTLNPWPPFVDAMVLTFAAFFLIAIATIAQQRKTLASLESSQAEIVQLKAAKARVDKRLRALATSAALEVDDGRLILQGEVLFDSGSAELKDVAALQALSGPLKEILTAEPDQMVMVAGHTDDVPLRSQKRFASNFDLSSARALSVANALIGAQVPSNRVVTAGFGEHHPRVANSDDAARRQNRRIEVLLVPFKAVAN